MQNTFTTDNPVVVVCTPLPNEDLNHLTSDWVRARINLIPPFGVSHREINVDGYPIDEARNIAAHTAMKCKSRYLFFHDYDVILVPETLHRLVYLAQNNPDVDIFSGLYASQTTPSYPLIWINNEVYWDWCPGAVINNVDYVGMGCTLIRTSLFERLGDSNNPFFMTTTECTEDIFFLNRCHNELNSKIMCDTSLFCMHQNIQTGEVFELPDDSLPMKYYREQLEHPQNS